MGYNLLSCLFESQKLKIAHVYSEERCTINANFLKNSKYRRVIKSRRERKKKRETSKREREEKKGEGSVLRKDSMSVCLVISRLHKEGRDRISYKIRTREIQETTPTGSNLL